MEELEKKIQKGKNDKYQMSKLYNEQYKQKFKTLNDGKISGKEWHNTLQNLCNYKKKKHLLDTLNGPIAPYIKLNR